MTATMSDWRIAFDARQKAVREHPLYPSLYHRVAVAEAISHRPVTHRNRFKTFGTTLESDGYEYYVDYDFRKSLPDNPPRYGWGQAMKRAERIAEMMLDDIFPDPWSSRGDMLAAITCTARDDVRARIAVRKARR